MNFDRKKWRLLHTVKLATSIVLIAEPVQKARQCLHCNRPHSRLHAFGIRWSEFVGLPVRNKPVLVVVKRNRYKCLECGRTFLQPMSGVGQKHRLHADAIAYIHQRAPLETHSSIARALGIDSKTVFNVVADWIDQRESEYRPRAPRWIGIDEIELMGERRVLITDRHTGNIVDLLSTRTRQTVRTACFRWKAATATEMVFTVPWNGYRIALRDIIPHARLIVHSSHVLECARRCLRRWLWTAYNGLSLDNRHRFEGDRLLFRTRQDSFIRDPHFPPYWSSRLPLLAPAFKITQDFYRIYDARCREEAETRYAAWKSTIPRPLAPSFDHVLTLIRCWHVEIFRHFDFSKLISCATRDSALERIRGQLRNGRGYSFDVLRAKVLFAPKQFPEPAAEPSRPSFKP
jgi:transposase